MNKKEFGKLIAALRKEKMDEQMQFWTQKTLGDLSGLGETIVGKIERGQKSHFEQETLVSLADALQLTSMERKEFFFAALGLENKMVARVPAEIDALVTPLRRQVAQIRLPLFIHDHYGDIIVANETILRLFDFSPAFINKAKTEPAGFNFINLFFNEDSPLSESLGKEWRRIALHNIQYFRLITLQQRSTPYFLQLFKALSKNVRFRRLWQESYYEDDDRYINSEQYQFRHGRFGPLTYSALISTIVTPYGDLHLVTYAPADEATASLFTNLASIGGGKLQTFKKWPQELYG